MVLHIVDFKRNQKKFFNLNTILIFEQVNPSACYKKRNKQTSCKQRDDFLDLMQTQISSLRHRYDGQ